MQTFHLQIIFVTALALSLCLTPLFARLARRLKIVDHPAHRKTHAQTTPYLGGAAILAALILAFAFGTGLRTDLPKYLAGPGLVKALYILAASLGMAFVGLLDDMKNIRPRFKLFGQLLFASLFAVFGFRFDVLHIPGLHPASLSIFAIPVTVFWIVSVVNAFNMIDGIDGLAAAVTAGCLTLLAAGTALLENMTQLMMALAALGAVFGFLPYNWKPAKIYMGDMGSGGLGMFLACSLVALGQTLGKPSSIPGEKIMGQPFHYQILIATLLVAYPALEITLTVSRRLLRGKPITRGDQGHIHHRLAKIGFNPTATCLIAVALTLLPGMAALATTAKYHGWATWILAICGVVVGFGLSILGYLDFLKPKMAGDLRAHFQIAHHFISMQRIKLTLATSREEVLTLINQSCQELGVDSYRLIVTAGGDKRGGLDYSHEWDSRHPADSKAPMDKVRLPESQGAAEWIFEPHSEAEEELNMEYRVLISEFMRNALEIALRLGKNKATLEVPSVASLPHRSMSGHSLRKRRKSHKETSAP